MQTSSQASLYTIWLKSRYRRCRLSGGSCRYGRSFLKVRTFNRSSNIYWIAKSNCLWSSSRGTTRPRVLRSPCTRIVAQISLLLMALCLMEAIKSTKIAVIPQITTINLMEPATFLSSNLHFLSTNKMEWPSWARSVPLRPISKSTGPQTILDRHTANCLGRISWKSLTTQAILWSKVQTSLLTLKKSNK